MVFDESSLRVDSGNLIDPRVSILFRIGWVLHIDWCSIDNQEFLVSVAPIVKPWVEGTIPSRKVNLDHTW
jgi:hypothetical protein